jgi:hypothetical protein
MQDEIRRAGDFGVTFLCAHASTVLQRIAFIVANIETLLIHYEYKN